MKAVWRSVKILGAAILLTVTAVDAQERTGSNELAPEAARGERVITPEEFREILIEWAIVSERAYQTGEDLAVKIGNLNDEQIAAWLDMIADPVDFVGSLQNVIDRQQETQAPVMNMPGVQAPVPGSPLPALTTPFPPDYPPGTGPYADTILNAISSYGIGGASATNRCSNADWGDYVGVWWPLNETFDALDGACVVAGCDPIGIACAITCGILEVAKVALKVAAVPLEACDVHQSAVDGAEIEAIYENTLGVVGDVAHLHTDLGTHDTDLKAALSAHDANIDGDLAMHDSDMKAALATHDSNLMTHDAEMKAALAAHDANIDGDLQQHDADIKELIGDVQDTLDEKLELRLVHMQVLELVEREKYLIATTEAGLPVGVSFDSIEYYDTAISTFQNLGTASVLEVEPGLYELTLNLSPRVSAYVFRLRVRHAEKYDHFGEILFHWDMEGFTN